nr:hypothetical protein [Tanacetum cinerariifolium]
MCGGYKIRCGGLGSRFDVLDGVCGAAAFMEKKEEMWPFLGPKNESFGDTIKIGMDVTHPMPVTSTVFPASTVMMRLDQHLEAIIQEHLLEVPLQEEVWALRDRLDVAEAERATLRATVRMMGAVRQFFVTV